MWHNNKQVLQTFASHDSQNARANVETLGSKKIKKDDPDGVTNIFVQMNAAKANNRTASVHLDGNEIDIAYLL